MNDSDSYTLKEMQKIIMNDVSEIQKCIESIEGHLGKLNSKVATHELQITQTKSDVEVAAKRISAIETFQWKVTGIAIGVMALVQVVLHFI